jgi:hypothetical protein
MKKQEISQEKSDAGLSQEEITALRDMNAIRYKGHDQETDRKAAFKARYLAYLSQPNRDIQSGVGFLNDEGNLVHKDVNNEHDLTTMLTYLHGEQYHREALEEIYEENPHLRPDKKDTPGMIPQQEMVEGKKIELPLTDEQLAYIVEVEERAGMEFNDYQEALDWEDHEYDDKNIDEDMER